MVGRARGEDLRLAGETAEGAGLDDAFAIALEGRAVRVRGGRVDALRERGVAVIRAADCEGLALLL